MKGMIGLNTYFEKKRGCRDVVWLAAMMLTVLAVLTAPLAMSKYTASGMGSAKARVAKFDVKFGDMDGNIPRLQEKGAAIKYMYPSTALNMNPNPAISTAPIALWQEMPITNFSEVRVKVTVFAIYRDDKDAAFPANADAAWADANKSNAFRILAYTDAAHGNGAKDVKLAAGDITNNANSWSFEIAPDRTAWATVDFYSAGFDGYNAAFGGTAGAAAHKIRFYLRAEQID